jgi:chromosome segregation ATPase
MEQLRHDAMEATLNAQTTQACEVVQRYDVALQTESEYVEDDVNESTMQSEVENARMIVDLKTLLNTSDERAVVAERERDAIKLREEESLKTFEETMETLRQETVVRIEECRKDVERANEETRMARSQRAALGAELDQLRSLASDAQQRTIEVHRNTLEEIRRRDTESRSVTETLRVQHSELRVREEMTANENRTLKRRVDELISESEDAKRLRTSILTERAREEAERDSLRTQLMSTRAELDAMRSANVDLESQLAVLRATTKLESCRRSLSSSGKVM